MHRIVFDVEDELILVYRSTQVLQEACEQLIAILFRRQEKRFVLLNLAPRILIVVPAIVEGRFKRFTKTCADFWMAVDNPTQQVCA